MSTHPERVGAITIALDDSVEADKCKESEPSVVPEPELAPSPNKGTRRWWFPWKLIHAPRARTGRGSSRVAPRRGERRGKNIEHYFPTIVIRLIECIFDSSDFDTFPGIEDHFGFAPPVYAV